MNQPATLSLEQQLQLRLIADRVLSMTQVEAQAALLEVYEQMLVKDTMYKEMLKQKWGIGDVPSLGGME